MKGAPLRRPKACACYDTVIPHSHATRPARNPPQSTQHWGDEPPWGTPEEAPTPPEPNVLLNQSYGPEFLNKRSGPDGGGREGAARNVNIDERLGHPNGVALAQDEEYVLNKAFANKTGPGVFTIRRLGRHILYDL